MKSDLFLISCIATGFTIAQAAADSHGSGERRKPPKEAIEACSSQASGDTCNFSGREKEQVSGKCWSPNEDLPLACKPEKGEVAKGKGASHPPHSEEDQ